MLGVDRYSEQDMERARKLAKSDITACFIYSSNYLSYGKVKKYSGGNSVKAVQKSGCTLAPLEFFEGQETIKTVKGFDCLTLTAFGNTVKCAPPCQEYTVNGEGRRFTVSPAVKEGIIYLPVLEVCRALGLNAESYNDGRLVAVADETTHAELKSNVRVQYALSCVMMGEYDPYSLTHVDYVLTKNKWRRTIVGDRSINDSGLEGTVRKLKEIEMDCTSALAIFNRNEDAVILFGTEAPTVSYELRRQYGYLFKLAQAYGSFGNPYYRDEKLKNDILYGLQWLYENMYGEAEMTGKGWRDAHDFNWYDWFIGAPDPLTDVMLIMEEHLTEEQKQNYLRPFKWITTIHRVEKDHPCAMSRIVVCTKMGLLLEDPSWLEREYEDYHLLLALNEYGEGPRIDGCEWTHTHPYNMIYGINNLARVLKVGSILAGTPAEYRSPRQYNLFFLVKYMFEAAIYKGQGMVMFDGRDNGSAEMKNGVAILSYVISMIGMFGDDEDGYLKNMIRRNSVRTEFLTKLKSFCSLYNCALLEQILEEDGVSENYRLGYSWFTADRAVQHRNGYCFALAMCSERGRNYESINGDNKTGWYTGDGALFLYTDADSHAYDGVNFISSLDVSYRIPGTTVDTQKREIKSIKSAWHMPRSFVGSMQIDHEFVTAAMDYESYHFEGPYDDSPDVGYGGGLPLHSNDLVAKKSWFMLDRECVCLGAGINSTTGFEVNTVVEHRRLVKTDEKLRGVEDITADGKLLPKEEYEISREGVRSINVEGFAGFVFPEKCEVYISRYQRTDNLSACPYFGELKDDGKGKPYIEIRIKHGENPVDGTYAYYSVPTATEEDLTRSYKEVEIISNTKKCQAVRKKNIGLTSMVFYEAGECSGVTTDTPLIIMIREQGGVMTFSVCDPTQKAKNARITLSGSFDLIDANDRMTVKCTDEKTLIKVDFRESFSRNLVATFNIIKHYKGE